MTQQQFYDKIVSRLDNLIGAVNKLTRTIEAMEKEKDGMYISLTDGSKLHKYTDQLNEMDQDIE